MIMKYSRAEGAYFGKCSNGKIVRVKENEYNLAAVQGSIARFDADYWGWIQDVNQETVTFIEKLPHIEEEDQIQQVYDLFRIWCRYQRYNMFAVQLSFLGDAVKIKVLAHGIHKAEETHHFDDGNAAMEWMYQAIDKRKDLYSKKISIEL